MFRSHPSRARGGKREERGKEERGRREGGEREGGGRGGGGREGGTNEAGEREVGEREGREAQVSGWSESSEGRVRRTCTSMEVQITRE